MSFAIEVPGEAVPLNFQDLCKALQAGTSSNHNQRQAATQQLDAWQSHASFFSSLQNAYLDRSLPADVRLLAIIMLKNGVDRNWRSAATVKGGLQPAEKALIRSRLFQGTIDEQERALALQSALLTAKIVRIDYPQEWSSALPELIAILRSAKTAHPTQLHGTLFLLLRVIKELATARLRRSQTALQQIAEELFYVLGEVYGPATAVWTDFLRSGHGDAAAVQYAMANSLTALKTMRHLAVSGFEDPHHCKLVQEFWSLSHVHLEQFLGLVNHQGGAEADNYQDMIGKHLLQLTKLHIDICDSRPASFALLPNSVALARAYWSLVSRFADMFITSGGLRQGGGGGGGGAAKAKVEGPLLEKLALKGLLLLKAAYQMIGQPTVAFKNRSEESRNEQAQGMRLMETELFTSEFMLQIVEVIVSKLFVFRESDLEAWDEDPEAWEQEESENGAAWQWQVRPCAERLFLSLLIRNKRLLVPPLLAYLEQAMSGDIDLLKKEALYTAMGNAAVAIDGAFNFEAFVTSTLVQDAQVQGALARVLRRRVAMLLSSWAFYEMKPEGVRAVYTITTHLLNKNDAANDLVVRLTAARQIEATVKISFMAEEFDPFSTSVFSSLMELLAEAESEETKLMILETIRVLIERMETTAAKFSDSVVAALPAVWESAGPDAYMIKQAVLAILSSLILALKAESLRYHALILPLVADAVNQTTAEYEHLFEDGLELWSSVMTMSTAPLSEGLVQLLPTVLPLLEYDSPVVETCLQIVKAYTVIGPATVLAEAHRQPTLRALASALETTRPEQVKEAASVLRLVVQVAQMLGGAEGVSVVVQDLRAVGLLPRMLERIRGAWEARQTTGPKARAPPISTTMEMQYFSILSWVAVAEPAVLVRAVLGGEGEGEAAAERVWRWLAAEWFGVFELMGSSEHLKLACLGLTRLCELGPPVRTLVLARLQDYFSMWTSAVADAQGDSTQPDSYVWKGPAAPTPYDTPLQTAQTALAAREPMAVETTYDFVVRRLQNLVVECGGETAFEAQWAVNVDRDVLAGFRALSERRPDE